MVNVDYWESLPEWRAVCSPHKSEIKGYEDERHFYDTANPVHFIFTLGHFYPDRTKQLLCDLIKDQAAKLEDSWAKTVLLSLRVDASAEEIKLIQLWSKQHHAMGKTLEDYADWRLVLAAHNLCKILSDSVHKKLSGMAYVSALMNIASHLHLLGDKNNQDTTRRLMQEKLSFEEWVALGGLQINI